MVKHFYREDYEDICKWWRARRMPVIPYDVLPTYGLIAPGVAAGFLVQTDSTVAILDFYISNPLSNRVDRDKMIDVITQGLIDRARSAGFRVIKADTQLAAISTRAKKHGFESLGTFEALILKE